MCSAARCIVRNAQPAKNSEAIFWRPRFTWPLRAGKRANANFACSEGVSAPGAPRHVPGWPFLRGLPLLCWLLCPVPVFPFCIVRAGFLPCFHPSLPNFFLSNFFSFVAHAATGTPFSFRKENGGKEPRGGAIGAPFEPPFQRPAANLPFPRAAGRLKRPFRPQTAGR